MIALMSCVCAWVDVKASGETGDGVAVYCRYGRAFGYFR